MTKIDNRAEFNQLRENTTIHEAAFYCRAADLPVSEINVGFAKHEATRLLGSIVDLVSQRDIIAELNGILEKGAPTIGALAKIGLPNSDAAHEVLSYLPHTYLHMDIRQLPPSDISDLDSHLGKNCSRDVVLLKAFLEAYEQAGRQFPLQYKEREITLRLSEAAAPIFKTLAAGVRTNEGLLPKLRLLAADITDG